jgi:hypothetical protein
MSSARNFSTLPQNTFETVTLKMIQPGSFPPLFIFLHPAQTSQLSSNTHQLDFFLKNRPQVFHSIFAETVAEVTIFERVVGSNPANVFWLRMYAANCDLNAFLL